MLKFMMIPIMIHTWFLSISIKANQGLNKQIFTFEGDKKLFEFVLKSMDENHLQDIHDFAQFGVEVTNHYDLDDDDDMYDVPPYGHQYLFHK